MRKSIRFNFCSIIIFVNLMFMQTDIFFPNHNITNIWYRVFNCIRYAMAAGLVFFTWTQRNKINFNSKIKSYLFMLLIPFALFFVAEMIAAIQSPVVREFGIRYWTRDATYFFDKISVVILVICSWLLLDKKTLEMATITLLINNATILFVTIFEEGIIETLKIFPIVLGLAKENAATKIMEIHELTYCLGLLLIYYLFFKKNKSKKDNLYISLLSLFFMLGGKRIAFFGLIVCGLFAYIVSKKNLSKIGLITIGIFGFFISFGYVYIVYNNKFIEIMDLLRINTMGRDIIYRYFVRRTTFATDYLGWGLSGVAKVIENMDPKEAINMVNVRGLHNDLLKMYINLGFIGFTAWLIINLIIFPLFINEKLGKCRATLYLCITAFAFITYLTDNTENYSIFQFILFLVPIAGDIEYELVDVDDNSYTMNENF